jgi:chromate reductase
MRILGISGSLRAASSNRAVLEAAARLAPPNIEVVLYNGLSDLPPFNPDLEGEMVAPAVVDWRAQLRASNAIMISTPDYAHGVPGTLKNALDWVVGSGELVGKPVAVVNTSPRAFHAQASIFETLTTMSAALTGEACVLVPLLDKNMNAATIAAHSEFSNTLRLALLALTSTIAQEASCPA